MEDETHAGLEASFEIGAVEESHAEDAARVAHFHQEHAFAIAGEADGGAGGDFSLNGVSIARDDFGDGREADAVFVAKGKIV